MNHYMELQDGNGVLHSEQVWHFPLCVGVWVIKAWKIRFKQWKSSSERSDPKRAFSDWSLCLYPAFETEAKLAFLTAFFWSPPQELYKETHTPHSVFLKQGGPRNQWELHTAGRHAQPLNTSAWQTTAEISRRLGRAVSIKKGPL